MNHAHVKFNILFIYRQVLYFLFQKVILSKYIMNNFIRVYKPNSVNPACSSGRRPSGHRNRRSSSLIGKSLIEA